MRLEWLPLAVLTLLISASTQFGRLAATTTSSRTQFSAAGSSDELSPQVVAALLSDTRFPGRVSDTDLVQEAWTALMGRARKWASETVRVKWAPYVQQKMSLVALNASCERDLRLLLLSFGELDTWAVQMIDSWGKFPTPGLIEGTWTDLGSYYECLEAEIPPEDVSLSRPSPRLDSTVRPQYCTVEFRPLMPPRPRYHNILHPLPLATNLTRDMHDKVFEAVSAKVHFAYYMPFRVGVCVPSSCSLVDLDHLTKQVGLDLVLHGRVARCDSQEDLNRKSLTGGQWCAIVMLAIFTCLCLCGTWVDVRGRRTKSTLVRWQQLMSAFSVPRNLRNIFNTSSSASELTCIHGLRVVMITWIIMGHTFLWINYTAFGRSFEVAKMITPFHVQPLFHVNIAVDAFFFMSGLLTTYSTWKVLKSHSQFSSTLFILARYWRVTPTFAASILLTLLVPLLSSGPLWHETVDPVVRGCEANWWVNLLYLHNWVNLDNICLLHTWYLANDMQFHIASLIVVWALLRGARFGLLTNGLAIVAFTVTSFLLTFINDYPPYSVTTQPEVEERWDYVLYYKFRPWVHGGAFCVGLGIGYILARDKLPRFSRAQLALGWSLTLSAFAVITFGVYPWNNGEPYSAAMSALYSSTHRTLWAAGMAWIVLVCCNGQGGFVNGFLSWKPFIPLGRICYSIYLTHGWFIMLFMGSVRQRLDAGLHFGLYMFTGHWLLSILFSFLFAVMFESPFLVLQKDLLTSWAKSRESLGGRPDAVAAHGGDDLGHDEDETSIRLTFTPVENNNDLNEGGISDERMAQKKNGTNGSGSRLKDLNGHST